MFTVAQQARRIESTRGNCDRKPRVSRVYYFKNRNPEFKEFKKEQKKKKINIASSFFISIFLVYFRI